MNQRQQKSLDMYKDVARILEDHGIEFYAACGTLIGAVRHHGFIPWDWDIDLYIKEKDLETVNEILKENLDSKKYYYHIPTADTNPHVFFKEGDFEDLLKRKEAVYMDLFVLCDYPTSKMRRVIVRSMIFILSWCDATLIDKIKNMKIHNALTIIPIIAKKIAKDVASSESDKYIVFSTNYYLNIFPKCCFDDRILIGFEDVEMPIPNGYDTILKTRYGNYMVPPKDSNEKKPAGYPTSVYKDYRKNQDSTR